MVSNELPTSIGGAVGESNGRAIRVLAVVEATTVTGPIKNLLDFFRFCAHNPNTVQMSFAMFQRGGKAAAPSQFLEATAQLGISVHCIPEDFPFDVRILRGFRELVERLQPDIIQTHASKSHVVMRVSGTWRHRPWIGFHHGDSWPRLRSRLYNRLGHRSLRAAAQVVAVSEASKHYLITRGLSQHRIIVIHNAVKAFDKNGRPERAAKLRSRLGIAPAAPVILSIGRLSPEKDHVQLVAALGHLRTLNPTLAPELIILETVRNANGSSSRSLLQACRIT